MGYQQVGRVEELEEVCRAPLSLPLHLPLLIASPADALVPALRLPLNLDRPS